MRSSKRVEFCAPEQLIEQVDILATAENRDRTDVLIDALRTYLSDASESDEMKRDLVNAYFEGDISDDAVQALLGPKEAGNFRLLKEQLEDRKLTEELVDS